MARLSGVSALGRSTSESNLNHALTSRAKYNVSTFDRLNPKKVAEKQAAAKYISSLLDNGDKKYIYTQDLRMQGSKYIYTQGAQPKGSNALRHNMNLVDKKLESYHINGKSLTSKQIHVALQTGKLGNIDLKNKANADIVAVLKEKNYLLYQSNKSVGGIGFSDTAKAWASEGVKDTDFEQGAKQINTAKKATWMVKKSGQRTLSAGVNLTDGVIKSTHSGVQNAKIISNKIQTEYKSFVAKRQGNFAAAKKWKTDGIKQRNAFRSKKATFKANTTTRDKINKFIAKPVKTTGRVVGKTVGRQLVRLPGVNKVVSQAKRVRNLVGLIGKTIRGRLRNNIVTRTISRTIGRPIGFAFRIPGKISWVFNYLKKKLLALLAIGSIGVVGLTVILIPFLSWFTYRYGGDEETYDERIERVCITSAAYLDDLDFTPEHIVAMWAVWLCESNLDPTAVETVFDEPFVFGSNKQEIYPSPYGSSTVFFDTIKKDKFGVLVPKTKDVWDIALQKYVTVSYQALEPGTYHEWLDQKGFNSSAYYDGSEAYMGIGLAQWTGPRAHRLIEFGKNYNDIDPQRWYGEGDGYDMGYVVACQLDYMFDESNAGDGSYRVLNNFKANTYDKSPDSLKEAVKIFANQFEGTPLDMVDNDGDGVAESENKFIAERIGSLDVAIQYYNEFIENYFDEYEVGAFAVGSGGSGSSSGVAFSPAEIDAIMASIAWDETDPYRAPREAIVRTALSNVGKAYIWGGSGNPGYDCSGFCQAALGSVGISVPHSAAFYRDNANAFGDLKPGDILYRPSSSSATGNHCMVYIGNGQIAEAKGKKWGCTYGGKFSYTAIFRPFP